METLVTPLPHPIMPAPEPPGSSPSHDGFAGLTVAGQAMHAEILHRAQSIWESKGRGDDHQLADWLEAEAEVLAQS